MRSFVLAGLAGLLSASALSAQTIIAHYPFTRGSLDTCDEHRDSVACPISFGNKVTKTYNKICLGSDWKASTQGSTDYLKNRFDIKMIPSNMASLCYTSLRLSLKRDDTSVVRFLDIRSSVDNYKTVLKTVKLPDTTRYLTWKTFVIDLSGIKSIQDKKTPVTIRVHLYGKQKTKNPCPTCLDEVILKGKAKGAMPPCENLSLYSFTRGTRQSEDGDRQSVASTVSTNIRISVGAKDGRDYVAKFSKSDWGPSKRNSTQYNKQRFDFSVTPIAGYDVSVREISFYIWRDANSPVCWVDVRADEDPGAAGNNFKDVLKQFFLGKPSGTGSWVKYTIPVHDVKQLQGAVAKLAIRVHLWGECTMKGWSDTYFDYLTSCGNSDECVRSGIRHLGGPGCTRTNLLTVSNRPSFGTTVTVNARTNAPKDPYYFFVSVGCGDGKMNFPGTNCKVWLNLGRFYLWQRVILDANGRGSTKMPILPAYSYAAGLDVGLQGVLWTASGDTTSNGICLRIGCK